MRPRHAAHRAGLLLALLPLAPPAIGPGGAQTPASKPSAAAAPKESDIAARAGEEVLLFEDLHALLLLRHAFSPDGRDLLRHLVQTRMIDHLGEKEGVRVSQGDINALWDQLDRDAKKSGIEGGMAAEIERTGMTHEELRELLRLQILQQALTRKALGLADGARVTGDQMEVWIDAKIQERGLEVLPPPWTDGIVAACGEVRIGVTEFADLLARHLPYKEVRDAAFHLLLLRGVEARMPDLSAEARARAIRDEVETRRRKIESDPSYRGLSFESVIGAQGMTPQSLEQDPSVAIAALSDAWVSRAYDEQALRRAYAKERTFFDDRFGEALSLSALFLRGAKFKNRWNPRSFEEAEAELNGLKEKLVSLDAFAEAARALSEDQRSKAAGGALGWVTRGDDSVPRAIRDAAFGHVGTGRAIPAGGVLLGPVRMENGAALVWLGARRDGPGWETMSGCVRQELRRRFLNDVLRQEDVRTFRDG